MVFDFVLLIREYNTFSVLRKKKAIIPLTRVLLYNVSIKCFFFCRAFGVLKSYVFFLLHHMPIYIFTSRLYTVYCIILFVKKSFIRLREYCFFFFTTKQLLHKNTYNVTLFLYIVYIGSVEFF